MTASTRSKLMMCLVVGLITLPAEALLLPVARTPNPVVAATEWAASLDAAELREAASKIDAYPAHYRKAIMSGLTPADRADAWRAFFVKHMEANPSLTQDQIDVLHEAIALVTPEAFVIPVRPELKEQIGRVFGKAQKVLGKVAATELFVTLGPKQLSRPNALPLTQRLADNVRSWRVVSAQSTSGGGGETTTAECQCNVEIDTCDLLPNPWLQCSEQYVCEFDLTWPMCGPLWSWACTGWCKVIRWPWDTE